MRCLFGFLCVCALGTLGVVGCSETAGTDLQPAFCDRDDAVVVNNGVYERVQLTEDWAYLDEAATGACLSPCDTCVVALNELGHLYSSDNKCSTICQQDADCSSVQEPPAGAVCVGECGVKACVWPCESDSDCSGGSDHCSLGMCLWGT